MTIGPAPMIRMLWRSLRLGMRTILHRTDETIEKVGNVARARRGFGVALEGKSRTIGPRESLQGTIEQRHMGHAAVSGQRFRIHSEAMILRGDKDLLGVDVLYRVVGAVMPKSHLCRPRATCLRHQLVAEANTERRNSALHHFPRHVDRVIARLGVARSVG